MAVLFMVLVAFGYFIPMMVAFKRDHPSKGGIVVVNIFFGWSMIGWVIALAWACSGRHSAPVAENHHSIDKGRYESLTR